MKDTPNAIPAKDSFDPNSNEYILSAALASNVRENTSRILGDLLTIVEFAFGDTKQAESMKKLVKQAMWQLMDDNQHQIYYTFGVEPKQLRDSDFIEAVLNGTLEKWRKANPLTEPPIGTIIE